MQFINALPVFSSGIFEHVAVVLDGLLLALHLLDQIRVSVSKILEVDIVLMSVFGH